MNLAAWRKLAVAIVLAAVYFAAASYSFRWDIEQPFATPLWPPSGIALAALLVWGRHYWPAISIGAIAAYVSVGEAVVPSVLIAAGSTVEVLLAAWLLERYAEGVHTFDRVARVLVFIGIALAAPAIGALVASLGISVGVEVRFTGAARLWLIRWLAHSGGIIVMTPALVLWAMRRPLKVGPAQGWEQVILLGVLLALSGLNFGVPFGPAGGNPLGHAFYPLLAFTAFRLGVRATATLIVAICILAVWGTVRGNGPFAVGTIEKSLLMVQIFALVTGATALAISAAVLERAAAQNAILRLNEEEAALRVRLVQEEQARRTEAERLENRARYLDEAGVLMSGTLEPEKTMSHLAALVVPRLADWCVIHIRDADGEIRMAAASHVDPERLREVLQLFADYVPDPNAPQGSRKVIRTGEPDLWPEIPDELLVKTAQTPRHLELLRSLGFRSAMVVPMKVQQHAIGSITFVASASDKRYDRTDLELAQELADRAAIAVENARLYQQAQDAVRIREDFLSIASHELRTPITALRLQIQIIERALADELARRQDGDGQPPTTEALAKLTERARTLNDQSRRLTELVNGLFDVTGIAAGKLELQLQDADMLEIVDTIVSAFRSVAAERGVTFEVVAPGPVLGRWDAVRVSQVLTNLLSNAMKYGAGKPVEVRLQQTADHVQVDVCDHGPGIAKEYHAKVFQRFERVPGAEAPPGLGLGLYIARQIAEAHGGKLTLESEPGCGAVFSLHLPRFTSPTKVGKAP